MSKELKSWIIIIVLAFFVAFLVRSFIAQPYRIEMTSMVDTLSPDDLVLVDKISYKLRSPKRGEVVIFTPPIDSKNKYIKRVIALPGETIEIKGNTVYIDGKVLNEPYVYSHILKGYGPEKISDGYVFVMGDNRSVSMDSRYFGPIPVGSIVGRAIIVYWPFNHIENLNAYSGETP